LVITSAPRGDAAWRTPDNAGRGVTGTIETLLREVAALLKKSAPLKMYAHELFKTADNLRHKADGMKDTPSEKPKAEDKQQ
jgi:hypothetical protein